MNLTLSQFFTHLLSTKNFYAMVANRLKRIMVPGLGTMAIGIRESRLVLLVDPDFVSKVSLGFGIWVIEHELSHVILDHIPRYLELLARHPVESDMYKRVKILYNIAMDCAVNVIIRHDKYFAAAQEGMRDKIAAQLEFAKKQGWVSSDTQLTPMDGLILPECYELSPEGSFESYLQELLEKKQDQLMLSEMDCIHIHWLDPSAGVSAGRGENDGNGKGVGSSESIKSVKSVEASDELQGLAQQIRSQMKQVLKSAIEECKKARGTVPAEYKEWLDSFLADPIIPWWDVLTTYVQTFKRSRFDRSISRPNRSLMAMAEEDLSIIPAIGFERDPRYRIFFMVDTSGSMATSSLKIAASELTHLLSSDEDMEVRYIQGDAEVHFDQMLHSGDIIPTEIIGRGGTDFDAYFMYMSKYVHSDETCPDLVIVYTDGYAPNLAVENRLPPEIPVIWLMTPNNSPPENYGEIIICSPEHNHLHANGEH